MNTSQASPEMNYAGDSRWRNIRLITIAMGVLSAIAAIGFIFQRARQPDWQLIVLSVAYLACTGVAFLTVTSLYPRQQFMRGMIVTSLSLGFVSLLLSAMLSEAGITAAFMLIIFSLMISSSLSDERHADLSIIVGILFASLCFLLVDFSPFEQVTIQMLAIFLPGSLVVLLIACVVMLARGIIVSTLRIRLVTAFLAIVMVPLIALPIVQARFMFDTLTGQLNQSLLLSARQVSIGIDKFLEDQQVSVTEAAEIESLARYLELSREARSGSPEEEEIRQALRALDTTGISSDRNLSSFALLDLEGYNQFDTLVDRSGGKLSVGTQRILGQAASGAGEGGQAFEGEQDYFLVPARAGVPYISPLLLPTASRGFFYISAPVKNAQNQTVGVLRVRYDGYLLQDLLMRFKGLVGAESYAVLVDENNIRLADTFTPEFLYRSVDLLPEAKARILKENRRLPDLPIDQLATGYEEFGRALYSYESDPFFLLNIEEVQAGGPVAEIGAITRIQTMPWKVVYLQADFSDETLLIDQRKQNTLVTSLVAVLTGFLAVGAARVLSYPILRLTSTARQVTEGDLDAQAPAKGADEFGTLGAAFNSMTSQLRMLISQLEERVQARTREIESQNQALAHRARQLETVSDVARQIVSAQELETLLTTITHLISERFGFYHVGIFLLDENNVYAVLRAANSEGGQRMLARRHMLPVGKVGIVGYATGTGQVRIATDVGEDAVYFNNPDLPNTRSEMALPLKVGENTIGALDIQSTEPDSFQPDDVELFKTLADQVAVAIYNNRLYLDTLRALKEAESLHRQYLRSEWAGDIEQRKILGYVYNQSGITPQRTENPLLNKVFSTGEAMYAVLPSSNGSPDKAIMAVPIAVRGETIGVIQVQDQGGSRLWSEDEISVVNSIASQVAGALENARLFETTVRRAEREKKVMEITAKIRTTNDPEEMMQIAVSELQQALRATRTQIYIRKTEEDSRPEAGGGEPAQPGGSAGR